MPPRVTRRSVSRARELEQQISQSKTDHLSDISEDEEVNIDSLVNSATKKLIQLTSDSNSEISIDTTAMETLGKSIAKTLGISDKNSSSYNPTSRFLVPQADGLVSICQSSLTNSVANSSSVFLRAGTMSSAPKDPLEKLETEANIVADLASEMDGNHLKNKRIKKKDTAGRGWFDMPATQVTEEISNDFKVMKLRDHLYVDRFYKNEKSNIPKYFQIGTIVEGATDVLSSGRINKKDRKRTMTEELLADSDVKQHVKKKFHTLVGDTNTKKKTFSGKFADKSKKRR